MQTNAQYIGRLAARLNANAPGRFELLLDDLREVVATPQGQRVLRAIVDRCGVYREAEKINAELYVQQGERNIGLFIMQLIHQTPEGHQAWARVLTTFLEHGHE